MSGSPSSGANGAGKTTLLDALLGRGELSAGTRTLGPSVVVGEVEQARDRLSGPTTVLRAFQDATGMDAADVRTLLAKFGLVADHVTRPAATLSPGERTRASLALLMANGANVLVLDEPTNHLDLPAIEQLESALEGFDGTIILVTHDRALLDQVRLTRRVELAARARRPRRGAVGARPPQPQQPSSVSTAWRPRPSTTHAWRSTHPAASSLRTAWDSRLGDDRVAVARSPMPGGDRVPLTGRRGCPQSAAGTVADRCTSRSTQAVRCADVTRWRRRRCLGRHMSASLRRQNRAPPRC